MNVPKGMGYKIKYIMWRYFLILYNFSGIYLNKFHLGHIYLPYLTSVFIINKIKGIVLGLVKIILFKKMKIIYVFYILLLIKL